MTDVPMVPLVELMEVRFKGYDEAIQLLDKKTSAEPSTTELNGEIKALRLELSLRFVELEKRLSAVAASDQRGIEVALLAQKEATAKTENFNDRKIGALETRFNDLKETVNKIEFIGQGSKQSYGMMFAVIGAVATVITVGTLIIAKLG